MSRFQILDKRLTLRRPDDGFSVGIDGIVMAAACPARPGENVLDLGCGIGTAGLCVAARVKDVRLSGVEIQEREAALAQENGVAEVHYMDVREFGRTGGLEDSRTGTDNPLILQSSGPLVLSYDHVICNPPYLEAGAHVKSPDAARAGAMGHADATLEDWILCAHRALKSKGSLTMVHRADALDEIMRCLGKRFGAIEIIPLWPKAGAEAKRVIIRALKDRKTPTRLHAGLVLHEENGDYTAEAEGVLRDGQALFKT
jgi:tRNA1(Val) A37 N6-methylase TrmN6